VEHGLGAIIEGFDHFFGDSRKLDLESPSTRLQFKTFERTTQEQAFAWGSAVAASVHLPHLQELLGNARLVVLGENTSRGAPAPPVGTLPPEQGNPGPPAEAAPTDLSQSRGSAELRFDVFRQRVLVVDTGLGFTFAWPPTPFMRWRLHLRLSLGAGFVLRATEALFVELGGRGPGTSTDLLVERYLGPTVRLRWEGHGLLTWHTRGMEWNTLVGADWKVHPRTGLSAGLGANGFGTPAPTTDAVRAWIGVRQDLWRDRVFGELEPEVAWPQAPGQARRQVLGITFRLELLIDARPAVVGAAR
jgi:hypothetical protein